MYIFIHSMYTDIGLVVYDFLIASLGSTGSAPGLTVFVSEFLSRITQILRAICLYNLKYRNDTFLLVFLEFSLILGLIRRASCSIFTVALSFLQS